MGRVARLELEPEINCYPLSSMQQGMLFHALHARTPGVDISQVVVDCPEALDAGALEQAWQQVASRHEILRTRFLYEGLDEPRQQVQPQVKVPFKEKDWRGLAASEQAVRLEKLLHEERRTGFEAAVAPLMRVVVVQRGTKDFQMVWTYHHVLLDARSLPVVLKDLFVIYEALQEGREPKLLAPTRPYRGYIDWLRKQDWSEAEKFWREKLKDFTTPTPLMTACGGNGAEPEPGSVGEEELELSSELAAALGSLAKEHGLTLNTFLQGAWAILLARYTGEEEVVFGAVRACRRSSVEGAESMAGLFINTLPVRTRVSGTGLLPWLKQLRADWVAARPFEHTPLVKVQSWSQAPAGTLLFESILNVQDPFAPTILHMAGAN